MTILVATIGTRDLIYKTSSGKWYNAGDDRIQDGNIISEQLEVITDLGLNEKEYNSFRYLTEYIWTERELLIYQLQPVIIGQLLKDKSAELSHVYLVATNQNETVKQREKDTIYCAQIIKYLLEQLNNKIEVTIINLGENGENPSDFEAMFKWWQKTWREQIRVNQDETIILCLKGGVGQTSEAARISGLSLYGEQIQFYEFKQNHQTNRDGNPSAYSGPFLGTNYLWDRVRKESLQLLANYNYAAVEEILKPYFKQDTKLWSSTPTLIKAGIFWQQGEFTSFYNLAKNSLSTQQQNQAQQYWWMAYEQAYTAIVRMKQQNTTEAMLHSFRAVEALVFLALQKYYPQDIKYNNYDIPYYQQIEIIEQAIPDLANNQDFKTWIKTKRWRNDLSHNLGGISDKKLFEAWEVNGVDQWEERLVKCLNGITQQNFSSLYQASLFACTHHQVKQKITNLI